MWEYGGSACFGAFVASSTAQLAGLSEIHIFSTSVPILRSPSPSFPALTHLTVEVATKAPKHAEIRLSGQHRARGHTHAHTSTPAHTQEKPRYSHLRMHRAVDCIVIGR